MLVPSLTKLWAYRMVHYTNVQYILRHGMFTRGHHQQDPDYVFIGDTQLTALRHDYPVEIPGGGTLGDYVPFYLWPLTPMLLNIKTGWRGITQRPQRDIVYVCCAWQALHETGQRIVFTDGHAKDRISRFYENEADLDKLDWDTIRDPYWRNTEEDWDRQRRKQAELLVYQHVPPTCIGRLVVFDEARRQEMQEIVDAIKLPILVSVDNKHTFYYR